MGGIKSLNSVSPFTLFLTLFAISCGMFLAYLFHSEPFHALPNESSLLENNHSSKISPPLLPPYAVVNESCKIMEDPFLCDS